MRLIIGLLIFIAGILGGLYVAIWWGIVDPILTLGEAFDAGTLSGSVVAWEVCKFFLKEILAAVVIWAGIIIGKIVAGI